MLASLLQLLQEVSAAPGATPQARAGPMSGLSLCGTCLCLDNEAACGAGRRQDDQVPPGAAGGGGRSPITPPPQALGAEALALWVRLVELAGLGQMSWGLRRWGYHGTSFSPGVRVKRAGLCST